MILVAHSNFMVQDEKQRAKMRPYSPLSTLIAANLLKREGHAVRLFDATFEADLDAFEQMLAALRPDVVAIMEDNFNFLTKMCTTLRRETALRMIALADAAGCRVAVNGPDASDNPGAYLEAGADAIVQGEGERTLLDLVNCWQGSGEKLEAIPGLILAGRGMTGPHHSTRDLDGLPFPAWELLDIDAYRTAWTEAHGEFSWNVATSRGCPYGCNWCAKPTFGRRYITRSPGDVVEEVLGLRQAVAPDHLWFTDDIFGLEPGWLEAFADEVERRGARTPFTIQSRVNLISETATDALVRAGVREVWLGVESGSQKILDAMEKGTSVESARNATRTLKGHGVRAGWFIQLGYPSETWEDLMATRDLIRDEAPDEIGVSVAYPLPGTGFHERVRAQLGQRRNWRDTGELAMLFQGTFDTDFYRMVRDLLHEEVDGGSRHPAAWTRLAARAENHRSPAPLQLATRI